MRRRSLLCSSEEESEYVDLELPSGILWAKGNLVKDANGTYSIGNETDWGTYVSWGNIDGHNEGEGYNFNQTTYNSTPGASVSTDISSNDAEHDFALAALGAPWHLPTMELAQELYDNTDTQWVANYNGTGVAGWKFMKKTDHSVFIFLPASGYYNGTSLNYRGKYGFYWYSLFYSSTDAYYLGFYSSEVSPRSLNLRRYGRSVRPVRPCDYSKKYFTITSLEDNNEFVWKTTSGSEKTISISTDNGVTWTEKTSSSSGTAVATLNSGERFIVKGNVYPGYNSGYSSNFVASNKYEVSGNIMSICNGDNFKNVKALTKFGAFRLFFFGDENLISAENLILPATTITSLCYLEMFYNCTSLTTAPKELPATTLATQCYYEMFRGCTSLTASPILPAPVLVTYCYTRMFYGCTSLNYITCLATDNTSSNSTEDWLYNVPQQVNYNRGTFVRSLNNQGNLHWNYGSSGIITGWIERFTSDPNQIVYTSGYGTSELEVQPGIYKLECWGAQGGSVTVSSGTYAGGVGGYATGTLTLTSATTLYMYGGGTGRSALKAGADGGFNGGGAARTGNTSYRCASGGGGSDIRIGLDSLYARVIVAGGGGGAGYIYKGGFGGGTRGGNGGSTPGGTQTSGGNYDSSRCTASGFGIGAGYNYSLSSSSELNIAGGGGGWYGGGTYANSTTSTKSGAGGSGYVYTETDAANYPSGCLLNSSYYLTDATMSYSFNYSSNDWYGTILNPAGITESGHTGSGFVKITKIG